jgi:hypothetical protein
VDNLPELEITISAANQITLSFRDPRSGVVPNLRLGSWVQPPDLGHPEDDPNAHGRALRDALLHDQAVRDEFLRALTLTVRATPPRPLRVYLRLPPELQVLSWETLLNPDDDKPLLERRQIYFFRFLEGAEPIVTSTVRPRVLVFIASPERLRNEAVHSGNVRLHPVDVEGERDRARQGLRPLIPTEITSVPGRKGEASLDRLISELDNAPDPYDILYLVCHGAIYNDGAKLWLDEQNDDPVLAQLLVDGLRGLGPERRPRLVVLASCQSAGQPETQAEANIDRRAIVAIGPKLVQEAGIAAVMAMQGNVFMRSVKVMMPAFFKELVGSGQVEQAMAAARGRMRIQTDPLIRSQWRVPVLFSRLTDRPLWPAGQLKPRVAYLSHAIQSPGTEYDALTAVHGMLEDGGFDVLESDTCPATSVPWSQRLLEGLGTCDAAVLLLNERALTEADNWVQTEARILCWRHWLDHDFPPPVVLCLGKTCQSHLQEGIWPLLCAAGVPDLSGTTAEELQGILRERLAPLQQVGEGQTDWRLVNLRDRAALSFDEMRLPGILNSTWDRLQGIHGLKPLPNEDLGQRWARAILSRGPSLLLSLYDALGNQGPPARSHFIDLLPTAVPAWVDIRAAAQLVYLAKCGENTPGSFYLKRMDLEDDPVSWYAEAYAARACGQSRDLFSKSPCLILAMPVTADSYSDRLDEMRAALKRAIWEGDRELWSEVRRSVLGRRIVPDKLAEDTLTKEGQGTVDKVIQGCVTERAKRKCPVFLLLSSATAQDPQLLSLIRTSFGPVSFFFMGYYSPPAGVKDSVYLTSDFPEEEAYQAYEDSDTLNSKVT